MATRHTQSSIEAVRRLIKPNLHFDNETGQYSRPRGVEKILATHGAAVEGILELAVHGKFVRPKDEWTVDELVGDEFYTTPNARFARLGAIGMFPDDVAKITGLGVDAFAESIGYARRPEDGEGVVVGFKAQLAEQGYKIFYGEHEGQEVPELIVPKAPSLHVIQGIYPVDMEAAKELHANMDEL